MHIHRNRNPNERPPDCEDRGISLYVSVVAISEFTGMDAPMTEVWLTQINAPLHVCGGVRYVPCHRLVKFMTEQNQPPTDRYTAFAMLTAKLEPYVHEDETPSDVMGALRDTIMQDASLHGERPYRNEGYMITLSLTGLPVG